MYRERIKYLGQSRRSNISIYKRCFYIICGALLVACSLELFLLKNYVIDGGIIGISIIVSQVTTFKVGTLLFILNLPFLVIAFQYLGKGFVLLSLFALLVLVMGTSTLHPIPPLTSNPFIVVIFGGIIIGVGVGLIIRYGGSLDGTEIMAILLSKKTRISIGQYVMIFNSLIFGSAIFVFGILEALYSLATYLIASKTIDITIKNL